MIRKEYLGVRMIIFLKTQNIKILHLPHCPGTAISLPFKSISNTETSRLGKSKEINLEERKESGEDDKKLFISLSVIRLSVYLFYP